MCKNRLARSLYRRMVFFAAPPETLKQVWDKEEDSLDPRLVYLADAVCSTRGYFVGTTHLAVKNKLIECTPEIQNDPKPEELNYEEASGMVAYLVETYGKETVFGNWDIDPDSMDTVYQETFSELYHDWAVWNEEQCKRSGVMIH